MPWHYQLLEASLRRNPGLAARIRLFKVGLGPPDDMGQSLCMSAEAHNAAATSASLGACAPGAGVTVPMTTLDAVLAESWPITPNFLKIDVEGFEPLIFEGAKQLLAKPPAVMSELVPFRVKRAIRQGQDPFDVFFGMFPSAAFDFKVINQAYYNITDDMSYNQTVAKLREMSDADTSFSGGNLVITPRVGGGRHASSAR
jgi:FkbM family methyltransferase